MRKRLFDKEKYQDIKSLVNRENYKRVSKKIKNRGLNLSNVYNYYIDKLILDIEKMIDNNETIKSTNRFYYEEI